MSGVLSGMTGFGSGTRTGAFGTVSVEARSVNGKGLDVRLRLPAGFEALEATLKDMTRARFSRGSVSLTATLDAPQGELGVHIDEARLTAFAEAAKALYAKGLAREPSAGELLTLKGVITQDEAAPSQEDTAELIAAATEAASEALAGLQQARHSEGQALAEILEEHLSEIASLRDDAASNTSALPQTIKARLQAKFDELLPSGLDPDRLEAEAAALAVKADIREELDRLAAHVIEARKLLASGSPCGRKLDFLSQEFNREANTLCSKAADGELTRAGLAMKAAVDRMREQVQNVE